MPEDSIQLPDTKTGETHEFSEIGDRSHSSSVTRALDLATPVRSPTVGIPENSGRKGSADPLEARRASMSDLSSPSSAEPSPTLSDMSSSSKSAGKSKSGALSAFKTTASLTGTVLSAGFSALTDRSKPFAGITEDKVRSVLSQRENPESTKSGSDDKAARLHSAMQSVSKSKSSSLFANMAKHIAKAKHPGLQKALKSGAAHGEAGQAIQAGPDIARLTAAMKRSSSHMSSRFMMKVAKKIGQAKQRKSASSEPPKTAQQPPPKPRTKAVS